MNEDRMRELAERLGDVIGDLVEEYPDAGFVIAAAVPIGERADIAMASNIDKDGVSDLLGLFRDRVDIIQERSVGSLH